MTLHDRYVSALQAKGHIIMPNGPFKYTRLLRKPIQVRDTNTGALRMVNTYYYVGKSGAVRAGRTVQASVPCADGWKASLIA